VLRAEALESILTKELRYVGSRYPLCSVIRTRKFLARGWTINAGQYVKMCFQISQLDLLILAGQLGRAIFQTSECAGPLRLKIPFFLENLLGSTPVANGQVVDTSNSMGLGELEGTEGCVFIGIDSCKPFQGVQA
jgi:hypothetical protein